MRIDAHQHFWQYSAHPQDYVWMGDHQAVLRRDFGPDELRPLLTDLGFGGCIAVQAREVPAETDFLLALAAAHPFILGVVGWIDLCDPAVEGELERYADQKALKGLRMLIHDRADPDFADSAAHRRGVGLLQRHGLAYDLLLRPRHLPSATRLVDALPNQRFVVDHIAKPDIAAGEMEPWLIGMRRLAERPNVCCKLSSLTTQADWREWQPDHLLPYLDAVYAAFGADRLMIGSDWPVCLTAGSYFRTMGVVIDWTRSLSPSERAAILGGTAARFYQVATD